MKQEPEKTCEPCGEAQSIHRFHKDRREPDGRHRSCKLCRAGIARQRAEQPKSRAEYARARRAAYRVLNPLLPRERKPPAPRRRPAPEVERAQAAAWRKANPETVRTIQQRRYERRKAEGRTQSDILSNSYVAALFGVPVAVLPAALIDAKRAQIRLQREIKEQAQ